MVDSAFGTSEANVRPVLVVEIDDPSYTEYMDTLKGYVLSITPQGNMAAAANRGLYELTHHEGAFDIYGFVGDDVRFRTKGWDDDIRDALRYPGIAYADDGIQGENLATHWFVSGSIIKAVQKIALPPTKHFYLDNAWTDLGKELGCLRYLPDVKIEHLHFTANKSKMDATYERSQKWWKSGEDQQAYEEWRNSPEWDKLVARARKALWVA